LTNQAASIGELHHAIRQGRVSINNVHAELGDIVTGTKQGRETDDEVIIFDSTGMALQDVATAAIVYEKAIASNMGIRMNFAPI
jgi:ornithine cyclodeaminase/alanine dehydrogenase-like protein (mu-crystallin family)